MDDGQSLLVLSVDRSMAPTKPHTKPDSDLTLGVNEIQAKSSSSRSTSKLSNNREDASKQIVGRLVTKHALYITTQVRW